MNTNKSVGAFYVIDNIFIPKVVALKDLESSDIPSAIQRRGEKDTKTIHVGLYKTAKEIYPNLNYKDSYMDETRGLIDYDGDFIIFIWYYPDKNDLNKIVDDIMHNFNLTDLDSKLVIYDLNKKTCIKLDNGGQHIIWEQKLLSIRDLLQHGLE